MRRSIVLTGSLLLLPVVIQAQGRGGSMAMGSMGGSRPVAVGRAVAAAPRMGAVSHMVPAGSGVRVMTSTGVRTVPSGSLVRVRTANGGVRIIQRRIHPASNGVRFVGQGFDFDDGIVNTAPGLGFDFVHFAATHPNARFRHSRTIGGFFPFFDGGFALPASPVVVEDSPVETVDGSGNEIVEEMPVRRVVRTMPIEEPAPVAQSAPPAPVRDSSEYVFVRRDGTVFFAVAYSWEQNTLRYITTQGVRGSVTREALDLTATQKFNEQRGMSFIAPA